MLTHSVISFLRSCNSQNNMQFLSDVQGWYKNISKMHLG